MGLPVKAQTVKVAKVSEVTAVGTPIASEAVVLRPESPAASSS
jgi:hypothetical protein